MCNEKKNSSSHERAIKAFPNPKYFNLVDSLSKSEGVSRSKVVSTAIKSYFDNMPDQEKERIVNNSKNSY